MPMRRTGAIVTIPITWSYIGRVSDASPNAASSCNMHANTQSGDVVIFVFRTNGTGPTSVDNGFTTFDGILGTMDHIFAYKIVDGTETNITPNSVGNTTYRYISTFTFRPSRPINNLYLDDEAEFSESGSNPTALNVGGSAGRAQFFVGVATGGTVPVEPTVTFFQAREARYTAVTSSYRTWTDVFLGDDAGTEDLMWDGNDCGSLNYTYAAAFSAD